MNIGRRSNYLRRQNIAFSMVLLAIMTCSALVRKLSIALAVVFHEASELIAAGHKSYK
jgi:Cd2+/Zn2+-exporting ATPase